MMNLILLTILIISAIIILLPEVLATILGIVMITIIFIKLLKEWKEEMED